jgi:hypothetical protein
MLCNQEIACQSEGGTFNPWTLDSEDGSVIQRPYCSYDASVDAPVTITIPCGNANPDPCICGRPEASASAQILCDQETTCRSEGGTFEPLTFESPDGSIQGPACSLREGGPVEASFDAADTGEIADVVSADGHD